MGSNIGRREENIKKAIKLLEEEDINIAKMSSFYLTVPMFFQHQPSFLNVAVEIKTDVFPYQLLWIVKNVEKRMGRRSLFKNAPRIIDIDILFYEDFIIETSTLEIPHPGVESRPFFIIPMVEIAPYFVHPRIGATMVDIARRRVLRGVELWKKAG